MTFAEICTVLTNNKDSLYDICYDNAKDYEHTPHFITLKRAKILYVREAHDGCTDVVVFTDGIIRYVWSVTDIKSINLSK